MKDRQTNDVEITQALGRGWKCLQSKKVFPIVHAFFLPFLLLLGFFLAVGKRRVTATGWKGVWLSGNIERAWIRQAGRRPSIVVRNGASAPTAESISEPPG